MSLQRSIPTKKRKSTPIQVRSAKAKLGVSLSSVRTAKAQTGRIRLSPISIAELRRERNTAYQYLIK